jgi:transposase InsO family protein
MRRAEIQKKGDFGRRDVTLLNRHAKVARTGEVAVDISSKARISGSLRCLPLAQFGSVFAGFHAQHFSCDGSVPQKSLAMIARGQATKPSAANVLPQQARFDAFVERYNRERPHQALGMKVPADLNTRSARVYRGRAEVMYPFQ